MENLISIAEKFRIDGVAESVMPLGDGFINDTYIVRTQGTAPDYILQRKNSDIFPDIDGMMGNIDKVTAHIRRKVEAAGGDSLREVITVVPTADGALYHTDAEGRHWAMSVFIADTVAYSRADSPALAFMGGMGIGKFQAQLADFDMPLAETIKGFHNIRHRFGQWDAALAADRAGRVGELAEEIEWIESRRGEMLDFWRRVENGAIPSRVTHNDTKISNILFDGDGRVLCVIDLDTVLRAPVLNDFGDAIRTYANTGAEDDPQLERVGLSMPMFEAFTDGYLSQQAVMLTKTELDTLAFGARYITYEQVLRFLMDYIDGDRYYKIKYPEHNLVRTRAQYRLLQSMEAHYAAMKRTVEEIAKKYI